MTSAPHVASLAMASLHATFIRPTHASCEATRITATHRRTNERTDPMRFRSMTAAVAAIVLIAGAVVPSFAQAQQPQPVRVGVCNPARCFSDMQETKDLKQNMENQ